VWPDVSAADVVENADGTFNATATLRTEVTRDLDQATIRCEVSLQDEHKFESAGETPPYTVRCKFEPGACFYVHAEETSCVDRRQ